MCRGEGMKEHIKRWGERGGEVEEVTRVRRNRYNEGETVLNTWVG